ncbi:MAG: DNA-3-methyladenine glycosylase I [Chloroflexi bacterium]|nr:DNA-3-methyladenine glycosylase I [Chloroflexota bacterium]MYF80296.1 DNA-3-methyladenine glycosylase I [Chloroflexota bacterium]MYI04340.1 DNA-3-methyladenine glycosylase I [Chloroflexota bacterium]
MTDRCQWPGDDPDEIAYHDLEWGVPTVDESTLFEAITLEGAQAGLSWHTILLRRDGYRRAFLDWIVEAVAEIDESGVDALVQDTGIIRHRGKIEATIANARAILLLREQGMSLADVVWAYAESGNEPNPELQSQTDTSRAMSRELKRRGFRFVGPTTCYAFMQAVGIVNDHADDCFRFGEIAAMRDTLLSERSNT